ncbi:MAG TPA: lamin tail domain-containing protein [Anaerohalosphaeraceae bacterium]|nr:lamin tail domain-containing protein [Anaerohalosphaeraceae bacterium]
MAVCPEGDLDGNCSVDFEDLRLFASSWLDDDIVPANLNKTGLVDIRDFAILGQNWGEYGYKLVINELMADNAGTIEDPDEAGAYPDWFEIYNYGSLPVDVGGMFVTDKLSTPMLWQIPSNAPDQTTIQPGEFKVLWADEDPDQGPLHVNFKLSASGEAVGLFDSSGQQVDAVSFGGLGKDVSYGRYPNGGPDWQTFEVGTATPSLSNGGESADSGIVINEIMYHPGHDEAAFEPEPTALEYIEIVNQGTSAVPLHGWRLVDGVSFEFPAGTVLGSSEYLVIAANTETFSAHYPQVTNVVGGWVGKLSNSGEKITLVNSVGAVIDSVRYCDEGDWAQRLLGPADEYLHRGWIWSNAHDGGGKSLELINLRMSNENGQNWKASLAEQGTPGRPNSVTAVNTAPIILDVSHSPVIPSSTQQAAVTARIIDEVGTDLSVVLRWRVDTSVFVMSEYPVYDAASYTSVIMQDDGLHGDGQSGDGVYGAVIPAQANHKIIEFFVEASDSSAAMRTWPGPCDMDGQMQQTANLLYQVDDSFASETAWEKGKQPMYYIIMTEAQRGRLQEIGDGDDNQEQRYSDAQMNATFISVDGTDTHLRYGVGVRNRGEGSRRIPPNNYRVNFRHDDLWKEVSAININSKYTYLQLMGSVLFQKAGLVAASAAAVQVRVNGENLALTDSIPSRMYGSYVHVEAIDGDFADNHFPGDGQGNVYKASIYPQVADLTYRGANPGDYTARGYTKGTNESENNWSDLFELTNVLQNEPDATYLQRLPQVVNTDQWIRWYAVQCLIGNNETNLGNGYGDDYRMYRGINDPRFVLITHDNDTILGLGDNPASPTASIWQMVAPHTNVTMTVIKRFLQHPEFVGKYYAELKRLTETVFAPANMNPLLDQMLGDFVPASQITKMKQFVVNRNASVLSQIPQAFTAVTSLSKVNGFYQTTASNVSVNGSANAIETRAVRVDGLPAAWAPVTGSWSCADVPLKPGINRVIIQTFDNPEGLGAELYRNYVDIWYNDDNQSTLSGTLTANTILDAASGPWQVTGDVVIPTGITLTIESGTTLFFDSGTGITVNGQLLAEGSEFARIRMTRLPGGSSWDGIKFSNTLSDNRLSFVDMEYGDSQGKSINIQSSRVLLDNMTWVSTGGTTQILDMSHPSALITHCIFPTVGGIETVHGTDLVGQEYLIFAENIFGSTSGYNDIVDFTGGQRPGPIIQFYNNTFLGGGDDGPDLDATDAHVEGNLFTNFHQTTPDQDSPSYAVATGDRSQVCIVRNIFVNNDHAILHKEDVYSWTQNNTIVNCAIAAVSFGEPFRSTPRDPGKGTYLDSNIFWNNAAIFEHYFDNPVGYGPTGSVGVYRSLLPESWHFFGQQNIDADPLFKDLLSDWTLLPGSTAIGTGSNGQDMGASVPAGASVWGQPEAITHQTDADLTVSGPGITHYKYRLVDNGMPGAWSDEIVLPINADDFPADPNAVYGRIHLDGLQHGHTYRVDVIGKNSAGLWQGQRFRDTDFFAPGKIDGNSSAEWTVETSSSRLMIHEVLANNLSNAHEGTYPDMIELYYDGSEPLDLGGYRLTDNKDSPAKFVFASGTMIDPGEYLIVYADAAAASGIHAGFALDSDGDDLYLLDPAGIVIDSVVFGCQLADKSIGRAGDNEVWTLTEPTPGLKNIPASRGDFRTLKINEWFADGSILYVNDWLEIYNPSPWPVDMGGLYVTDDPVAEPDKCRIPPLSFVAGKGCVKLTADGQDVSFSLHADGEMLAVFDADLNEIDNVVYGPQATDVSQGRTPDGGDRIQFFDLPTPGAANVNFSTMTTTEELVRIDDVWSYDQSRTEFAGWYTPNFNDSTWTTGAALLYVESSSLPAPKNTRLTLGAATYYFRRHFTFNGNPSDIDKLAFSAVIDDGAVFYLNGNRIHAIRMPDSVSYSTPANSPSVDNAVYEYFDVLPTNLLTGDNVIAVEVHQITPSSTDIVFGLKMDAVTTTSLFEDPYVNDRAVLNGLRITEMMYNPADDANAEYIELQNISDTVIHLNGVRLAGGVSFVFPDINLDPQQYILVVAQQAAFEARYGTTLPVAGVYSGKLDNAGEHIELKLAAPLDAAILRFDYKDGWYPSTDGDGHSLVIAAVDASPESWQQKDGWRESVSAGGSPGRADIGP